MASKVKDGYRVVLIGNSGAGKSTFGNFLLHNGQIFDVELSLGAVTGKGELAQTIIGKDTIYVIDTPGLCQASELLEDVDGMRQMTRALIFATGDGGVNAIVYVMSPADRFLEFQQSVLESLSKNDADPELFWSRVILVFSHAGSLGRNSQQQKQYIQETLQKQNCPVYFKRLMHRVSTRFVMFEAENTGAPEYCEALRTEFMQLVQQTSGERYQNYLMKNIAHQAVTPKFWKRILMGFREVYTIAKERAKRTFTSEADKLTEPTGATETTQSTKHSQNTEPAPELNSNHVVNFFKIESVLSMDSQFKEAQDILTRELHRAILEKQGCFPGESEVVTPEGTKKMKDLSLKDQVISLRADGNIAFTKIVTFLHYEQNRSFRYLCIRTEENSTLFISPCHLIFKAKASGSFVFASKVKPGDYILGVSSRTKKPEKVKNITSILSDGVFAPLTEDGTLVVDGIYVSCYAHTESHARAHCAFLPVRILNKFGMENSYHPTNGIHKYASLLKTVRD